MEHGQCSLCNERGHTASCCPDLVSPLKEGFQGGRGQGSHSHDEEDSVQFRVFKRIQAVEHSISIEYCEYGTKCLKSYLYKNE